MPLWGPQDIANNAPKYVTDAATGETGIQEYGDQVIFVRGDEGYPVKPGWARRIVGTGGRAGRVTWESLISFTPATVAAADPAYSGPQIVVIGYGQSNWLGHVSESSSPEAAAENTFYWDDGWTTVPAGNGIRALLNSIANETGLSVGLISGGAVGVNIAALQDGAGTGYFEALETKLTESEASQAAAIYIVFHQGEGNADSADPDTPSEYAAAMDTLHASIVSVIDRTKAQCPLICSSLANWVGGIATDDSWDDILNAQFTAHDTYPNIYYSHSNRTATVEDDGAHWDQPSMYGASGANYGHTILWLRGDVAARPNWGISSVSIVDATHTDVFLTHSMGTDFTPTSNITGFTLSIDGFSNTVVPTNAERQSANTIRLTHSTLATTSHREVRYQYGLYPNVSAPVIDNSALNVPLNHTSGQSFIALGEAADPVLTHKAAGRDTIDQGQIQGLAGIDLTPATTNTTVIVAIAHQNDGSAKATDVDITPNGGSPIAGSALYVPAIGADPYIEFWKVDIPAGTSGMNDADVTITLEVDPFSRLGIAVATVPTDDVDSWTPVDTDTTVGTDTVRTLNISTAEGGFYYAVGASMFAGASSATWTGDESPTERNDYTSGFGQNFTTAIANDTAAGTNDNTITVTYADSADMRLAAISIR